VAASTSFDGVPARYLPRSFPKRHFAAAGLLPSLDGYRNVCDLVHIHGCWNFFGWSAARWCRRAGIPYVVSPRGMLHPWSFAHGRIAKRLAYLLHESHVLRDARFIHVTSEEEAEVVTRLGVNARVVTVSNGVEVKEPASGDALDRFRRQISAGPDDFIVLYVGRLHPKKGLETLLQAFRPIALKRPRARLLIAGSGEADYLQRLRASARDLEAAGRVSFLGFLDGDQRRLAFATANAFAFTSHSENFGMSIAEAMAAGCPVVVGRGSPWPQIDAWQAGYWVENTSVQVTSALEALAADPAGARAMGQNGRRAVSQYLDWNRLAAQLVGAYRSALEHRVRLKSQGSETTASEPAPARTTDASEATACRPIG
jgi:glycosyltransferase involved in cell wall biosynthesis